MNNSHPPSSHTAAPAEPIRLGHYELHDCIGRGGMGLVYRARDTRLEREVAIKCLRTELFEAHYVERFKREALLLAKLNHPNIVQNYDFLEMPDQLALVMELVDGQNLQPYLREHIAPIAQRLQWLAQITEGLAVAHDAGIVHRDLKTENILINKRGQAKITDLGIAKSQDFTVTLTDHVAGSYCSMSPEQAMGEAITFKSDLFSLGILAYQLLCGAHPFGDTCNKLQTMQRIISHPPTAPQKYNPDLPAEFIDLLGQLLSKDPDKRPDNTHWVAAQFSKLKALNWQDESPSDDTQALTTPLPTGAKATRTQDHPTFDTRFIAMPITPKVSAWQKIKSYIATNASTFGSAAISLLIIAGVIVWQLQPKPPKYVAVIPPTLTADGMQVPQQELIKNAIYEAEQQAIAQSNGYYLISRSEMLELGDNKPTTIFEATAADELLTTDIECKQTTCTATISRLVRSDASASAKIITSQKAKTELLTTDLAAIAELIHSSFEKLYGNQLIIQDQSIPTHEYDTAIAIYSDYLKNGANEAMLSTLGALSQSSKASLNIQTIFTEILLDLYYKTGDIKLLDQRVAFILDNQSQRISHLLNLHAIYLAKRDFDQTRKIVAQLKSMDLGNAHLNELQAQTLILSGEYQQAIDILQRAQQLRETLSNNYALALAYFYKGDYPEANTHLEKILIFSPENYKALKLKGIIALSNGQTKEAIAAFGEILNKNEDISIMSNLGLAFLLEKKHENAFPLFEKAYLLAPENPSALLNLADAERLAGLASANESYQKLLLMVEGKTDRESLLVAAQAYAQLGSFVEAATTIQKLLQINAESVETQYTASLVYALAGENNSAIANARNAIKNGLHPIWYDLEWFTSLCSHKDFKTLLRKDSQQCLAAR